MRDRNDKLINSKESSEKTRNNEINRKICCNTKRYIRGNRKNK